MRLSKNLSSGFALGFIHFAKMPFTEENKKSFDFAADLIKQVITISAAVITITVSAAKFVFVSAEPEVLALMFYSWIAFIVSILFGLFAHMSLTGNLVRPREQGPSIYNPPTQALFGVHLISFLIGMILVACFSYAGQICEPLDANWICRRLL